MPTASTTRSPRDSYRTESSPCRPRQEIRHDAGRFAASGSGQPFPASETPRKSATPCFVCVWGMKAPRSAPIKGYAVLSLKDMQPAHPATLAEVHDTVFADYRREKAVDLAKTDADELGRRAKAGQDLDKAAKAMGLRYRRATWSPAWLSSRDWQRQPNSTRVHNV